jgi:poly-gamma-glutamate synthesis protein (capsule biosynthesis protein)
LRAEASKWDILPGDDPNSAAIILDLAQSAKPDSIWIYALVAPFPTVTDDISAGDLLDFWHGLGTGPFAGAPLWMTESTLAAFSIAWGRPAPGIVMTVSEDNLVDTVWAATPSWAIVPFEDLEPRLKVLSVDGNSPVRKDFNQSTYPLVLGFELNNSSFALPATNRDSSKMTIVMLTGVTALVRGTAAKMERYGLTYPGEDIRDILLASDILHINNEVPFYSLCDVPDPKKRELVFCSRVKYMELLKDIDTDVVELTGDHFADYGRQAMLETLQDYKDAGIPYYGGGANSEEARKPLLVEHNGNKIAFIGCDAKAAYATADETMPGNALCDYNYMREQIQKLRAQGYIVIATFQYEEYTTPKAPPAQMEKFRWQADSGANIVSGSQAHFAQVMEFHNGAFIHYGLGNLFFDQMGDTHGFDNIRQEFADSHVFYNGHYISTAIQTFMLMDYSRPRPMEPVERAKFLRYYFEQSGWMVSP